MTLNRPRLIHIFVFTGLFFSTARMIRGTDNLYILALISFLGIWILNYKLFLDLEFRKIVMWFIPFGIWAILTSIWSFDPLVSLSRGFFYIFIANTAVLIGFLYKKNNNQLFKIFLILNTIFVLLSVLSLISGIPNDAWTANHGMGFTSIFKHQNTLAAVLMFTLFGPIYYLMQAVIPGRSSIKTFEDRLNRESRKSHRHSEEQRDEESLEQENRKLEFNILDEAEESENNNSLDSRIRGNDNFRGSVIPAFRQARPVYLKPESKKMLKQDNNETCHSGLDPESQKGKSHSDEGQNLKIIRTDAEQQHFSMTKKSVIPEWLNRGSIFSFLLIVLNLYFIYLSYSRAVMLALFIGGLTFVYFIGTLKFNLIFTVILILLGSSIYFLFQNNITNYLKKGGNGYLNNRGILWKPSYEAALHGGIFGLGFGVTDPIVESNYKKENRFGEFKREKGNSVLALIEEVGIVGLVLFLLPMLKVIFGFVSFFKNAESRIQNSELKNQDSSARTSQLLNFSTSDSNRLSSSQFLYFLTFSFLCAFLIHAQFEAWWVGVSSLYLLINYIILSEFKFNPIQK